MNLSSWLLIAAIATGQLFKLPLSPNSGVTLLDMTVLILAIFGLFQIKAKLKKPPLALTGALLFILVATASLILTPLSLTLPQYLVSFLYTLRFGIYILLGWVIYSGVYPQLKDQIPRILLFSGISLSILGLAQFIFLPDLRFLEKDGWDPHYFRAVSTFLDPNFLGAYLSLTLILLSQKLSVKRYVLFFALVYLALLTTFSRGAYSAFLVSFITLAFLQKSAKMGIITIVLFLGLMLGFYIYQLEVAQPRGVDRTRSAELRLNTWQWGGTLFQNHLLLGVGFNAYRYALDQYNFADENFLSSHGSSTNDSSLLFVAATTGVIGLFAFLFFLFSMMQTNNLAAAGISGLMIQSFFTNILFYPFILIWIILMFSKQIDVHEKQ